MPASLEQRAAIHHALGEPRRLAMVEALWSGDLTPGELRELTGLPSNLLAFHLDVLEDVGLVCRHRSQGDQRRRYVTLARTAPLQLAVPAPAPAPVDRLLFVCSRNSARSQLAAALWTDRTGGPASSAGASPAQHVHPLAVEVAAEHGLDLEHAAPHAYGDITFLPTLVVSVCDRAREATLPFAAPLIHWSVPDPVDGDRSSFQSVFTLLESRVERLARQVAA